MFYIVIYLFFYPFLKVVSIFRKKTDKKLIIQNAVIGDYANSSILFEPLKPFDIVLASTNLAFANYDNRINKTYPIDKFKKELFGRYKLAFLIFLENYSEVYVLTPNSLNLFLAKFSFAKKIVTIKPQKPKFFAHKMVQIQHTTNDLTLHSYLKMIGIKELKYEKKIQSPLFIPEVSKIENNDKFKIGISLSAGNKIKTPPPQTWNKILKILSNFDCTIYIFGVKDEDKMLSKLNTKNLDIRNLVNQIPLKELPYHISLLNLYISSDTGNYYIADTMKIPTICLMGPCFSSEQRGVSNSLIINSSLPPISSVFNTVRNIDASRYFILSQEDEKKIYKFIHNLYKNSK
ncbi:glycosyltransferase family 9 protein [Campylobacter corcagiensis]|uniref:Lipopolysaccharide heptosyltransferase family protein n=1 Tax=Campylobacter corcagiensis TaxID=1448857 RepID=A0A7M1LDW4_9BACT|nr:glycosyltransferase family 9 protein [Campylobacter corcagiensis]QKF65079.1 glycosyltransferase, family 9 [Campylobacter corcagiensis]QOQ86772.1 lipopolysaccharide heptosyltransferase family protein [Campylobacter corcagiensis]